MVLFPSLSPSLGPPADPRQADPRQADPGQADPGQADPGQADPRQADPRGGPRGAQRVTAVMLYALLFLQKGHDTALQCVTLVLQPSHPADGTLYEEHQSVERTRYMYCLFIFGSAYLHLA